MSDIGSDLNHLSIKAFATTNEWSLTPWHDVPAIRSSCEKGTLNSRVVYLSVEEACSTVKSPIMKRSEWIMLVDALVGSRSRMQNNGTHESTWVLCFLRDVAPFTDPLRDLCTSLSSEWGLNNDYSIFLYIFRFQGHDYTQLHAIFQSSFHQYLHPHPKREKGVK